MKLVIVESPTKAKTLSQILPKDFEVEASNGHVRDLPKSGLGVDPQNNFEVEYEVPAKAKKVISKLKKILKDTSEVVLATDPDREGEAIAWHLKELLTPKKGEIKFGRAVFHELTKSAIEKAFEKLGDIDADLVEAQKARRVLDRLVGYKLSPLLWKKVRYGLSAGRVQSIAVRLIVEKEREREAFKSEEYWSMVGRFVVEKNKEEFNAGLVSKDGKKIEVKSKAKTKEIEKGLKSDTFKVLSVKKSERKRKPYAPLKTSTLQQSMANVFGFSAKKTMWAAQGLFEKGYITYHRTDSITLSSQFVKSVRDLILSEFGKKYLPLKPITYKTKSKGAQEAHEAIRPTDLKRLPKGGKDGLKLDEFKTYSMIWKRAIESQMNPVVYDQTTVEVISSPKKYLFRVTGSIVKFDGWYKVGEFLGISLESNGNGFGNGKFEKLPGVLEEDKLILKAVTSEQHFTQPPARYNDASLIKKLEELGVGRPSTYAPTISTIETRGYVEREGKTFVPKDVAFVVSDLLVKHFPKIVDYNFTADMEEDLDEVAEGRQKWVPLIRDFYIPFEKILEKKEKELSKSEVTKLGETDEKCPDCGKTLVVKLGKYGKFLSCSGYPDCKYARPLAEEENGDFGKCSECETGVFILRQGRFGKFLACSNYPKCKTTKPYLDKIGMKCPKCKTGDVVVKKAKKRKFYGCSNYPDCDYSSWKNPKPKKSKKREFITSLI